MKRAEKSKNCLSREAPHEGLGFENASKNEDALERRKEFGGAAGNEP